MKKYIEFCQDDVKKDWRIMSNIEIMQATSAYARFLNVGIHFAEKYEAVQKVTLFMCSN